MKTNAIAMDIQNLFKIYDIIINITFWLEHFLLCLLNY